MNNNMPYHNNPVLHEVYLGTDVLRRPITGIVSGYHELPYVLIAPDGADESQSIRVNGRISVSPRFVLSAETMGEAFAKVFDPETFDASLQGRLFSFVYNRQKNVKLTSERFEISNVSERAKAHLERTLDQMMKEENTVTALIYGPRFEYYPVSIDRFVNEVLDREFRF